MFGVGQWELIALGVVLLLLFGSKQLPQIGRSVGRGMREFKQTVGMVDPREDLRHTLDSPEDKSAAQRDPADRD